MDYTRSFVTCVSCPTCRLSCFWDECMSGERWWFCHSHGCIVFCCKISLQATCSILWSACARVTWGHTPLMGMLGHRNAPILLLDDAKRFPKWLCQFKLLSARVAYLLTDTPSWARSALNGSVAKQSWPLTFEDALPPLIIKYQHSYFSKWSPQRDSGGSCNKATVSLVAFLSGFYWIWNFQWGDKPIWLSQSWELHLIRCAHMSAGAFPEGQHPISLPGFSLCLLNNQLWRWRQIAGFSGVHAGGRRGYWGQGGQAGSFHRRRESPSLV